MTADEFARQLSEYLHTPIEPKSGKALIEAGARTGHALLDFVRAYDTSQVEIGMITFPPFPLKTTRGWHVGNFEADPIILDSATGELWLKEYGEDHVLCLCAKDSDRFMDALLTAAKFPEWDELEESGEVYVSPQADAEACAAAAGGARYFDFYYMLFGDE